MARSSDNEKLHESDDEEEIEASSDDDGSTESESEQDRPETLPLVAGKKFQSQSSSKAPQTHSSSSSSSSSSDEEESETESDEPAPKPMASKLVKIPGKSGGAACAPDSASAVKPTGAKRPPPPEERESDMMDSKKLKKKQPEAEPRGSEKKSSEDSKKQLFQRLWSEDDEIAILKGMVDYAEKKKSDPIADLNVFHEFIKDDLHVDVSKAQLQDKIRRLKKKYENNRSKETDGKDPVFSKPHECRTYELSKQIWGSGNGKELGGEELVGSSKVKGKYGRKIKTANAMERRDVSGGLDLDSNRSLVLFGGDKRTEEERELRKLEIIEMKLYLNKLDLMCSQTRLVLDVLKSEFY